MSYRLALFLLFASLTSSVYAQQCTVNNVSCSVSCTTGSGSVECNGNANTCKAHCSGSNGKEVQDALAVLLSTFRDGQGYADTNLVYRVAEALQQESAYDYYGTGFVAFTIRTDGWGSSVDVAPYNGPVDAGYGSVVVVRFPVEAFSALQQTYIYDLQQIIEQMGRPYY